MIHFLILNSDFFFHEQKEETGLMIRGKEEMMESGSGSEHMEEKYSGNEQETEEQHQQQASKKKRYHRHTAHQIQEMEKYYVDHYISPPLSFSQLFSRVKFSLMRDFRYASAE